eukprot:5466442-Ditylum_brightwellii.AAC.1
MEQQVLEVDNLHQNGTNSGFKGEECPAMEYRRSKVEPELQNEPKKPRNRIAKRQYEPTNKPMNRPKKLTEEPVMVDELKSDVELNKPEIHMKGVIQIIVGA